MKKSLLLIIILLFASCSTAKRCERHISKAKQFGCLNESDSTKVVVKYIKGDTLISYVNVYIDSNAFDSLNKKDTCYTKERVKTIIQKLKVTPVNQVNSNYNLKIWLDNGQIRYELKLPSRKDSIVYQTKYLEHKSTTREIPIWLIIAVAIMGVVSSIIALRSK